MASRFSVEAIFKAVDRMTAPVTKMQNRIGKFTRNTERSLRGVNKGFSKVSSGIKRVGVATVAALALVSFAMTDVIKTGADFEQAITDVGAVSLKTRDQMAALEKQALKLGETTKFTATQAARAQEVLSRAGFSVNDILTATPAILDAAAASGLEIAEVANYVSNALKGMGLATTEAARVADILALASSKTNSTMGSLGVSLSLVSSTARQLKVPIEDTVAAVALLQDVGLDASVAGSAFNTMLTKMAAPTAGMQKKMKRFGISFKDAKGDMLPIAKVLQQLAIASKKAGGNFDKVAFLAELVGLRGQKAAANLSDLFVSGKFTQLSKDLNNAAGSAKKMADIKMNTTLGSLTLLNSAIDSVKIAIFSANEGPIKDIIDQMTAWVIANKELIGTKVGKWLGLIVNNIGKIAATAVFVLKLVAAFYALFGVLKAVSLILSTVNLIMAANPIVLITLGVIALVAAIVLLVKNWEIAKRVIKSFFDKIPNWVLILGGLVTGPIGAFIAAAGLIIKHWEPVAVFFKKLWGGVVAGFEKAVSLKDKIVGAYDKNPVRQGNYGAIQSFGPTQNTASPQMITPQERIARSIEEKRSTHTNEVTLRDETGRAEVTQGTLGSGLKLVNSGAF